LNIEDPMHKNRSPETGSFLRTIEYLWRHTIVYPVLRLIMRNPISLDSINISNVKKILILRYDRIGDMIITTPIFRVLKKANPSLQIGVFASRTNAEVIRKNTFVDHIYILHNAWWSLCAEIMKARKEHYDVVINFIFNRTTSAGLLANLAAPHAFKVGQGDEKYQFYFNRLMHLERSRAHMLETLLFIVTEILKVTATDDQLQYEIALSPECEASVLHFLESHGIQPVNTSERFMFVAVNLSAGDFVRSLSAEQARHIVHVVKDILGFSPIVITDPSDRGMREIAVEQQKQNHCLHFIAGKPTPLLELAALLKRALLVISPDTGIIHFASATKTPVLGLYTPMQSIHEWLPYKVQHRIVAAPPGEPVSSIALERITQEIESFVGSLQLR